MDAPRRSEPSDEGTDQRVVDEGQDTAIEIRDAHQSSPEVAIVTCPDCDAAVALFDSECWRCTKYFSATTFDAQR